MAKFKMDNKIKELLSAHDVPSSTIDLIEDYYNSMISAIKDEFSKDDNKQQPKAKSENRVVTTADLARESRLIK